jgi:hypothetical protein
MTDEHAPTETDEELLSIPDPNLTGKLVGEVLEDDDGDR